MATAAKLNTAMLTSPKAVQPTTTVKGKLVAVTGTKGGAISKAQQEAKASRNKALPTVAKCGKYSGSQAIRLLPDAANPHHPGTYRFKAYDAMCKAKTCGEYAKQGFKTKYIERWVKMGLIRVGQ